MWVSRSSFANTRADTSHMISRNLSLIEPLERRTLRSADLVGVLHIEGTAADDKVYVTHVAGDPSMLQVMDNKHITTYIAANVTGITFDGHGGNDLFTVLDDSIGIAIDTTLVGGSGDDTLHGGIGNDRMYGGDGNDLLDGNGGHDVLYGEAGNDDMVGSNGNDYLDGGEGMDSVYGNKGDDHIIGGSNNDLLYGGYGNDVIRGYGGNDFIDGQTGDDDIDGGYGNDKVFGGEGNDDHVSAHDSLSEYRDDDSGDLGVNALLA
jgi:Ca2+-binding RTX toxin-like protein